MRYIAILFLCLPLFFASCGDDDDDAAALTSAELVGEWNLTDFDSESNVDIAGFGANAFTTRFDNSNVVMTFNSDGTWSSTGSYDLVVTTDGMTETDAETGGVGAGTYTLTGSQLTLVGLDSGDEADVDAITFDVVEFSAGALLRLDGSVDETTTDPFLGLSVSIQSDQELTLER